MSDLMERYTDAVEGKGGAWVAGKRLTRAELVERLEMEWHGTPPPAELKRLEITGELVELVELIRDALGE